MPIPLACDMSAIPAAERPKHQALTRHLMAAATHIRDVTDGLGFQFFASEYEAVARFIEYERRCCPFLAFWLTISPQGGPLDLRVTGPEGVNAFLRKELHLPTT
jgi:hypothetical protein